MLSHKVRSRVIAALAAMGVILGGGGFMATTAHAAGPAALAVSYQILDSSTGLPTTTVQSPATSYRVQVSFGCSLAECTDTQVFIAPPPLDPTYNQFRKENGASYAPPWPTGTSMTGSIATGFTVNLGDLAPGTNGSFTLTYSMPISPWLGYTIQNQVAPGSFFPNGSPIAPDITASSPNAQSDVTPTPNPASWVSTTPSDPTSSITATAATRTDTATTVTLAGSSRCWFWSGGGLAYGNGYLLCSKEIIDVVQLPPSAEYVPGSGGDYDPVAHTVTFTYSGLEATRGLDAPNPSFQVTFPSAGMPTSGPGCVATESFSSLTTLTYLDDQVRTTAAARNITVQNCDPFALGGLTKASTRDAGSVAAPIVYIPPTGSATIQRYWEVTASNRGNVPAVATIVDNTLGGVGNPIPARSVTVAAGGPATVDYTLSDGSTGTTTIANGGSFTPPGGLTISAVTATSASLVGPNTDPAGPFPNATNFTLRFTYDVPAGTAPQSVVNTATASLEYEATSGLGTLALPEISRTLTLQDRPDQLRFESTLGVPTVIGGGTPIIGSTVEWRANGYYTFATQDAALVPQYVFLAPLGWDIVPASATLAVPGATFEYKTVTYLGTDYNAVVATYPAPLTGVDTIAAAQLVVRTTPSVSAVAGAATAYSFFGDAGNVVPVSYNPAGGYVDSTDFDGDSSTTDRFAVYPRATTLSPTNSLQVVKEICQPEITSPDGCNWVADSGVVVGVPPTSTSIQYRVTIRNAGNGVLNNVVAYDVLPFPGDHGLTDATNGTPRNSTIVEQVSAVSNVSAGLALQYNTSTNPPRAEVFSGATDATAWTNGPAAGAAAIRATIGSLGVGQSVSFNYTAALVGAGAGEIACNSVATTATGVVAVEPSPVCATTQEADLAVEADEHFPLQGGRTGVIPFTVSNLGDTVNANGVVTLGIPAGVTVVDLTVAGWDCTSPSVAGPVDVTCIPVNGDGSVRPLVVGAPESLGITVQPNPLVTGAVCFTAAVAGLMHDPNLANNEDGLCSTVAPATPEIFLMKSDGRDGVLRGDELTYTITVSNGLVAEALTDLTLTDTLPAGVEFVSASDGGTIVDNVVTWTGIDLAASGEATADGDSTTGAPGSVATRTVTVRVLESASGVLVNEVHAEATDPATPSQTLTADAEDVDDLLSYTVSKELVSGAEGVFEGDVVTYSIEVANTGTALYPDASFRDDLSGVLDDGDYIPGSGSVTVTGSASVALPDPTGDELTWTGDLPAGGVAVITYQITATGGGDGVLANGVFTTPAGSVCDSDSGLDDSGATCDQTVTYFGPTLTKVVDSLEHNDDGTWTITYGVDVTSRNPEDAVEYSLRDALGLGAGLTLLDADVADAPGGVTVESWAGAGPVAVDVSLPAGSTHEYTIVVTADALDLAGTAPALCVDGTASGFANTATLEFTSGREITASACDEPSAPAVEKSVTASAQNPDGTWSTVYTVTVSAPADAPDTGLAYTLEDAFDFPAGASVIDVAVSGPAGVPVNPAFDGDSVLSLLTAPDRVFPDEPREYAVTVTTVVVAGAVTGGELACPTAGTGGYANSVVLYSGSSDTVLDGSSACTAVLAQPTPQITKSVTATEIDSVTGDWTLTYSITVTNPSAEYSTAYDLDDELQFGDGIAVASATVASPDATTSATWDGLGDTAVVADIALPAGAIHTYTVVVVASPPVVIDDSNATAMDCLVDAGEDGTGFRNVATLTTGAVAPAPFAVACEAAIDPSVLKSVVSAPVQDASGLWTVEYEITVTHRSTSTGPGGVPYSLEDSFAFPAGVDVIDVDVTGPGTINPAFDGQTETELATGSIEAAADSATPSRHEYRVTVTFAAPGGLGLDERACAVSGSGGLLNEVSLSVGERTTGDAACADMPESPVMGVGKSVLSQEQQADGTWLVLYRITVSNPSADSAGFYDLADEFALGDGIALVGAPTIVSRPAEAVIDAAFDGVASTTITENVLLPGGGEHVYTVRAVIDSGSVRGGDESGDCVLDAGEGGTGFLNTVSVDSGAEETIASACATAFDPAIAKEINGAPVLGADGSWTTSYVITVSNPSPDVDLAYELVDALGFPAGTEYVSATATARDDAPTPSAAWDGVTDTVVLPAGTALPGGAAHVFDVVVVAILPVDQTSADGGWANSATVSSSTGGAVASTDDAAADIAVPQLEVSKSVSASTAPEIGDTVTYTVTVENTGGGDYTTIFPAEVWDDLRDVLDDGSFGGAVSVTPDIGATVFDGERFVWRGPLAAGESVELTYDVVVTAAGNQVLTNLAFAPIAPGGTPESPAECEGTRCATLLTDLPGFLLEKEASSGVVVAGDRVDYTVTYTNTGLVDVADAAFSDDLHDVLDDATLVGAVEASVGVVALIDDVLEWTGPLAAGSSVTVTYSVVVNTPLSGNGLIVNTADADERFAPRWPDGVCPDGAAPCEPPERSVDVLTSIRALAFTKASDAAHATVGQKITYTLTVTNIGSSDFTADEPATIVDTMTGVLDDAVYNGDASAAVGEVVFSGTTLAWSGPIDAGQSVTITYSVTTNSRVSGDGVLQNVVGLTAADGPIGDIRECLDEPTDNAQQHCFVTLSIMPLAYTGGAITIVPVLVGLLLVLLGIVVVALRTRRARLTDAGLTP